MNVERLTAGLLEWYDRVQRALPWRTGKDPYRIWVSEVMLQQTRVETVIPYYERFIRRFPDMAALAEASEEDVLEEWQGLGYYSRARHLQKGVREVVAQYGGKVPETRDEILKIPGVGSYTAGAILSIAHEQAEPAVDGNVLRVFSRLLHIEDPIDRVQSRRTVETFVRGLLESCSRRSDITQALMELGALVCIPRTPRCSRCPWSEACVAFLRRDQNELPRKTMQKPPLSVEVNTGILQAQGRVFAIKRPLEGILGGMWEFPSVETASPAPEEAGLQQALIERFRAYGQNIVLESEWRELTHTFSHREWRMRIFFCKGESVDFSSQVGAVWLNPQEMEKIIWAGPHRKLAVWVKGELARDQERGF